MAKISEYLQDTKGNPSSTRLQAYTMMWFFMIFNLIMFPMMAQLEANIDWVIAILGFDFLVLLAIFAPKALNKIQEVKEIIELAKPNKY